MPLLSCADKIFSLFLCVLLVVLLVYRAWVQHNVHNTVFIESDLLAKEFLLVSVQDNTVFKSKNYPIWLSQTLPTYFFYSPLQ